jgi:hypothetical protein
MKLFSIGVVIHATAYVKAESAAEAFRKVSTDLKGQGIELSSRHQFATNNVCVDGRSYETLLDNEEDIALSPAMTVDDATLRFGDLELMHDYEETNDGE